MMGLRDRQKADRHRRMIDAAAHLFNHNGYESTSMEAIADRAEVSVGTVYNYYNNKAEILLAIVSDEGEKVHQAGARIIAARGDDARTAVEDLIALYVEHPMCFMRKEEWRQVFAMSILHPDTRFGDRYAEVEQSLCRQLTDLLALLVEDGRMRAVEDLVSLGEVLFHNVNAMFAVYVSNEAMELADIKTRLMAQTECVLGRLYVD